MVVKLSQTEVSQLFKDFKIELKQTVKSGDFRQVKVGEEFEWTIGYHPNERKVTGTLHQILKR